MENTLDKSINNWLPMSNAPAQLILVKSACGEELKAVPDLFPVNGYYACTHWINPTESKRVHALGWRPLHE